MSTIKDFEELEIWKNARPLVSKVYSDFREIKDYAFKDQVCRAAISVMNNISEGFGRGGNKEFIQFLKIARGSANELKNMYYIAFDLEYSDDDTRISRQQEIQGIINGISKLIQYLRSTK